MVPSITTLATCTPYSEYSSVNTCASVRVQRPRIVQRLSGVPLSPSQGKWRVGNQNRALASLPHRGQDLLDHQEGSAAGDVLRGFVHFEGNVFQQFFFRRKGATFHIACVINQDVWVAGLVPDLGERFRYGVARREVHLDDHAFAALFPDRFLQRSRVGGIARGQHDEEALFLQTSGRWLPLRPSARRPATRCRRAPYRGRNGCCAHLTATWMSPRPRRRQVFGLSSCRIPFVELSTARL